MTLDGDDNKNITTELGVGESTPAPPAKAPSTPAAATTWQTNNLDSPIHVHVARTSGTIANDWGRFMGGLMAIKELCPLSNQAVPKIDIDSGLANASSNLLKKCDYEDPNFEKAVAVATTNVANAPTVKQLTSEGLHNDFYIVDATEATQLLLDNSNSTLRSADKGQMKERLTTMLTKDIQAMGYNMHSPKDLKEHLNMHENNSDDSQGDLPKLIIYREDRASGAGRTTSNSSTKTTTPSQTPKKRSTKKDTTTETSPANNKRNKLN